MRRAGWGPARRVRALDALSARTVPGASIRAERSPPPPASAVADRSEVLENEPREGLAELGGHPTLRQRVGAVRVEHHREELPRFLQAIRKLERVLGVHVVVAGAVHD